MRPINVSCMSLGVRGKDPCAKRWFVSGLMKKIGSLAGEGRVMKMDRATRCWEKVGDG